MSTTAKKIGLYSDLHFEQSTLEASLEFFASCALEQLDILVLAGDVHYMESIPEFITPLLMKHPHLDIIFVPGNHEYYNLTKPKPESAQNKHLCIGRSMLAKDKHLRSFSQKTERFHLLQCDELEIAGIRFIGCTSWSLFNALGEEVKEASFDIAKKFIADFRFIETNEGDTFIPEACIALGTQHKSFLESALSKPCDQKTIVVTHFPPTTQLSHRKFPLSEQSPVGAYFVNDFESIVEDYQPDYWLFGHTHDNFDIMIGKTRLVSNQRGYIKEKVPVAHQAPFVIEL